MASMRSDIDVNKAIILGLGEKIDKVRKHFIKL